MVKLHFLSAADPSPRGFAPRRQFVCVRSPPPTTHILPPHPTPPHFAPCKRNALAPLARGSAAPLPATRTSCEYHADSVGISLVLRANITAPKAQYHVGIADISLRLRRNITFPHTKGQPLSRLPSVANMSIIHFRERNCS